MIDRDTIRKLTGFSFGLNPESKEVHIFKLNKPLCKIDIPNGELIVIGVTGNKFLSLKKLEGLTKDEAREVAATLQLLGIEVCGNCVRELYKTDKNK
jgi:predicted DNA-binding antitoxin AbrB/MazE fold protein